MYPADTIRTHVQSSQRIPMSPSRLYRGFGIVACFSAPSHAIFFATYDSIRDRSPVLAGVAAEMSGALLFTPQEVLKKRSQLALPGYQTSSPRKLFATVSKAIMNNPRQAVPDLYTGYWLSVATYGPFAALYFRVYETLRGPDVGLPAWCAAGSAGAGAAIATAPLDIALTRLQTGYKGAKSLKDVIVGIAEERAFFKGAGARAAWLAPLAAISLAAFEGITPAVEAVIAGPDVRQTPKSSAAG